MSYYFNSCFYTIYCDIVHVHAQCHLTHCCMSGPAPCPPENLQVQVLPMEVEVQGLYFKWSQVACPDVQYLLKLIGSLLGDSQAQFNLSSYWTNATYFEMPLPCGSSYLATVQGRGPAATSPPSEALNGTTGTRLPPPDHLHRDGLKT